MKKTFLLFACFVTCFSVFAQQADSLQKLARMQTQTGNYDTAYLTLQLALQQKPGDLDITKDQAFVCYLKRDFENGLRIGKTLTERPDADVQCFQILGWIYKSLAEYGEGDKMYKAAIKKFPESGVLYSEYGDLLLQNSQPNDAIDIWEKGIKADVNNNSNYYYASKYYADNGNLLWSLLYGEIFVNIESYTPRTEEIKKLLYNGYTKLFTGNTLAKINEKSKGLTKAITDILLKNNSSIQAGDTILNITGIRQKFIVDWVNSGNAKQFPFRLFGLHRQLVDAKTFTAYNEWLFGEAADADAFKKWQGTHAEEMKQWQQLLHSVVFKIPSGQYYTN